MAVPQGGMGGIFPPNIFLPPPQFSPPNNFKCVKISPNLTMVNGKFLRAFFTFWPPKKNSCPPLCPPPKNLDAGAATEIKENKKKKEKRMNKKKVKEKR